MDRKSLNFKHKELRQFLQIFDFYLRYLQIFARFVPRDNRKIAVEEKLKDNLTNIHSYYIYFLTEFNNPCRINSNINAYTTVIRII